MSSTFSWRRPSLELILSQPAHFGNIRDMEFSHDSRLLATAGHDNMIRIWEMPP